MEIQIIRRGRDPAWLLDFARNDFSQAGEDGVLEKILELLPETQDRWCDEFGAWDGEYLSNTASLIKNKGFSAVMIEANRSRFAVP
jgi:hypothetical protein